VGDLVLLADAPGLLSVLLGLGKVALAFVLECLGIAASCLVGLVASHAEGTKIATTRALVGVGAGVVGVCGVDGLAHLGSSLLAVTDGLFPVLLGFGYVALVLPFQRFGLELGGLLLAAVGNHDVTIELLLGVVLQLAHHGSDVALDGRGRMSGITDGGVLLHVCRAAIVTEWDGACGSRAAIGGACGGRAAIGGAHRHRGGRHGGCVEVVVLHDEG